MIKDIIGYTAAVSLILILFPQLHKTYKTKKVDDIAYGFIFLQILTCFLFLTYGILLKEIPMILSNVMIFLQSLLLIYFKIIYKNNNNNNNNVNNLINQTENNLNQITVI